MEEEKKTREVLEWHNQRRQAENFNKDLEVGFGMEQMSCGQTHANAIFFRIGVLAYNLFIGLKRLSCPECWMQQTIATFRWKMVQVAGRTVKHAGETSYIVSVKRKSKKKIKPLKTTDSKWVFIVNNTSPIESLQGFFDYSFDGSLALNEL